MSVAIKGRIVGGLDLDETTDAPLQLIKLAGLRASPEEVFAVVGDHVGMTGWVPGLTGVQLDSSEAAVEGEEGAVRVCEFADGSRLREEIVGWNPPHMYAFHIPDEYSFPEASSFEGHLTVFTCEPDGTGGTILAWRQYFNSEAPEAVRRMMAQIMEASLGNLVSRFGGRILDPAA